MAVIGGATWLFFGSDVFRPAAHTAAAATPVRQSMPVANVQLIEHDLDSSDRQQQAMAVAPDVREGYLQQTQPMFSPGTTVKLEPQTFQENGNAAAVVASTSVGEVFILHLIHSNNTWLITYTEAVKCSDC